MFARPVSFDAADFERQLGLLDQEVQFPNLIDGKPIRGKIVDVFAKLPEQLQHLIEKEKECCAHFFGHRKPEIDLETYKHKHARLMTLNADECLLSISLTVQDVIDNLKPLALDESAGPLNEEGEWVDDVKGESFYRDKIATLKKQMLEFTKVYELAKVWFVPPKNEADYLERLKGG